MFGLKFLAIMRRDLKKLTRNPITLISVILMPIVYLVIIGNSFQGQLKHLPIVVVEQDHGLYARRVVEQLLALQAGPKTVDVTFESDPEAIVDEELASARLHLRRKRHQWKRRGQWSRRLGLAAGDKRAEQQSHGENNPKQGQPRAKTVNRAQRFYLYR